MGINPDLMQEVRCAHEVPWRLVGDRSSLMIEENEQRVRVLLIESKAKVKVIQADPHSN
jgi:hypothetical protein